MARDPKPGWTRWWCQRCRRGLVNDPSLEDNPADSVTPQDAGAKIFFKHDGCGGEVALSGRNYCR